MNNAHLQWPFFEDHHRTLAAELEAWAAASVAHIHSDDNDADCKQLVSLLGEAGWLRHAVAGQAFGGQGETVDTRTICLLRETLARHNGLADFAFAMQGLGSGPISLDGSDAQKKAYLPRVASGQAIAAFALSEPDAGSD
ncbi:MAG: acyl-CoA dehydrogenase, partial [Burkholderiaceae bacterium]